MERRGNKRSDEIELQEAAEVERRRLQHRASGIDGRQAYMVTLGKALPNQVALDRKKAYTGPSVAALDVAAVNGREGSLINRLDGGDAFV